MKKIICLFILPGVIFLSGCQDRNEPIISSSYITATLPSTQTPQPTAAQIPNTSTVEVIVAQAPVEGVTTTQLNLRSEPSTAGETLGTVAAFSKVQIIGRESNGAWYQITDAASPNTTGWIIASYVQVNSQSLIPIIDLGTTALVIQGVNVRNGPGKDYASLGTLVARDVVAVSGRDASGAWLQIEFKKNAGWVAAEFMQVSELEIIPVIAAPAGEIPTEEAPPVTGAAAVARPDNDTLETPGVIAALAPSAAGAVQSKGSVSTPGHDEADWIQFTVQGLMVSIQAVCTSDSVRVDLYENGSIRSEGLLKCNETKILNIVSGQPYTIKLLANAAAADITTYTVIIKLVR